MHYEEMAHMADEERKRRREEGEGAVEETSVSKQLNDIADYPPMHFGGPVSADNIRDDVMEWAHDYPYGRLFTPKHQHIVAALLAQENENAQMRALLAEFYSTDTLQNSSLLVNDYMAIREKVRQFLKGGEDGQREGNTIHQAETADSGVNCGRGDDSVSPTPLPVGDAPKALTEFELEHVGSYGNASRIQAAIRELAQFREAAITRHDRQQAQIDALKAEDEINENLAMQVDAMSNRNVLRDEKLDALMDAVLSLYTAPTKEISKLREMKKGHDGD